MARSIMWRQPHLSLILCAFGAHSWTMRRLPAMEDPDTIQRFWRCTRCGALR